ncbi:MAG: Spy/CpxP family protein refolding chaperone [Burkholderiales bacterium]
MKRMNFRKAMGAAVLIGATIMAADAMADPPQAAYGPGYGMMGGYGPGHGMSPGMMGGFGPGYGMSPDMMGGYSPGFDRNLNAEQRRKIAKIQDEVRHKNWELMGKMQDEQSQMNEQYYSDKRDDDALRKSYRKMSELRHEMFDLSLSAQKQIDAVLTE